MKCLALFWLVALGACGSDDGTSGPPLRAKTTFVVTEQTGAGQSPLDPLYTQTIDIEVVFPDVVVTKGYEGDTPECKSKMIESPMADRTAFGDTAQLVQTELLDRLAYWDVRFQLCSTGKSSVVLHSEIAPLNLAFGCFGIPAAAVMRKDGYPRMSSFIATECSATILDVVANRVLSNPSFTIDFQLAKTL